MLPTDARFGEISDFHVSPRDYESFNEASLIENLRTKIVTRELFGNNTSKALVLFVEKVYLMLSNCRFEYVKKGRPANANYRFFLERYVQVFSKCGGTI